MHRWWDRVEGQHYWIEVTDRKDIGRDLNAPLQDEKGRAYWSYSLLGEADDGDAVFHFRKQAELIVGYSTIRGEPWQDEVVWGARGTSARGRDVQPYARPGLVRGLQAFTPLDAPIRLQDIRAASATVIAIRDELKARFGSPLYFPFVPYRGQAVRPAQGYLFKLPAELVTALGLPVVPSNPEATVLTQRPAPAAPSLTDPGDHYREEDEEAAVSVAMPMVPDPALIERGLRSHRRTQNALASWLRGAGLAPLSPTGRDPDWDIAWVKDGQYFVGEVKSLTAANEERQLRLGLGQVLRYRQQLARYNVTAVAVLIAEREPSDCSWLDLCQALGVSLVWPDTWGTLLHQSSAQL